MNLSLIIYTSELQIPFSKICAEQFNVHASDLNISKYIVSNKIPNRDIINNLGFNLIDTNVELKSDKSQFQEVLLKSLSQIENDYVMIFLDDYWLINKFKVDSLSKVMNVIENENIDYLSLMSYGYSDNKILNIDYDNYGLPYDILLFANEKHQHLYSMQPNIWKKTSLIQLLTNNPNLTMIDMDNTRIKNLKGEMRHSFESYGLYVTPEDFWDYNFKHCWFNRSKSTAFFTFDEHDGLSDYFMFQYSEVGRGGKFAFNGGGVNNGNFIKNFLSEKNITSEDEIFNKYF